MAQGVLHLPVTAMPAHVKANPVEVSLLRSEAIVFVTKHLAHLLQQTLGLGKIGDGVYCFKTMYKTTALVQKNKLSSGLRGVRIDLSSQACQLIPSDILESQDIRPSTSPS